MLTVQHYHAAIITIQLFSVTEKKKEMGLEHKLLTSGQANR